MKPKETGDPWYTTLPLNYFLQCHSKGIDNILHSPPLASVTMNKIAIIKHYKSVPVPWVAVCSQGHIPPFHLIMLPTEVYPTT